jgi:hypothetical protein
MLEKFTLAGSPAEPLTGFTIASADYDNDLVRDITTTTYDTADKIRNKMTEQEESAIKQLIIYLDTVIAMKTEWDNLKTGVANLRESIQTKYKGL